MLKREFVELCAQCASPPVLAALVRLTATFDCAKEVLDAQGAELERCYEKVKQYDWLYACSEKKLTTVQTWCEQRHALLGEILDAHTAWQEDAKRRQQALCDREVDKLRAWKRKYQDQVASLEKQRKLLLQQGPEQVAALEHQRREYQDQLRARDEELRARTAEVERLEAERTQRKQEHAALLARVQEM